MRKNRTSRIIWAFSVLTISLLLAGCGSGGGHSSNAATEGTDPDSAVTFTYSLDSGQLNGLPAGTDHIDVVLDGKETTYEVTARITVYAEADSAETGSQTLTFHVDPGEHTFTIIALQGTTQIAKIGPITFTKVDGIPITTPIAFAFPSFDHYATRVGTDGTDTIIGSDKNDRIVQYGLAGDDNLIVSGGGGNDWIEQFGGSGSDMIKASLGDGDSYVYQSGGDGTSTLYANGGTAGTQTFVQAGGQGYNTITVNDGANTGTAHIEQQGGPSGNTMKITGAMGSDVITISGGAGSDSITYNMTDGTDTVTIDGNVGNDLLTINTNGVTNYTIKDSSGTIFSHGTGGTTITVTSIEGIRLVDEDGDTISTWGNPPSPLAPAVPAVPDGSGFNNVVPPVLAVSGDITQIVNGTAGRDLIAMYGGTGNVKQIVNGNAGDDWILQVTEGTACKQTVNAGDGSDTVYQFITGNGSATQVIEGGVTGAQTFVQVGGQGVNTMTADDSSNSGSARISQYGGPAGNTMEVTGSESNDLISMNGGAGNDTLTYDMTSGNDAVMINGDAGDNMLTVNTQGETNYTLKDSSGNALYTSGTGGTAITVLNVQHITVLDLNGDTVWSR